MEIQGAEVVALQLHSRATPTAIVPVPPEGPKDCAEFVTLAWQRTEVGLVTLVFAELPQPTQPSASAAAIAAGYS